MVVDSSTDGKKTSKDNAMINRLASRRLKWGGGKENDNPRQTYKSK